MQIIPIASVGSSVHGEDVVRATRLCCTSSSTRRYPGHATRHEEQGGGLQLMLGGPVLLREVVLPIVQERLVGGCGS
eukprot:5505939-Heterocapsa_arctica.AAC.1